MIRLRRPTARSVTVPVTFAAVAVVVMSLAGCSDEGSPSLKASPGSTASPGTSGAGALKDESGAVLAWTPPAPVARTEGKLSTSFSPGPATVPSTAEIISVKAGADSTILTWQLKSATDLTAAGWSLGNISVTDFWPDEVRLVDPVGKRSYAINTMVLHGKVAVLDKTYCVCARYPTHVGPDPVLMTAAYPPLPSTATSVSVRIPYFAPVTVPVTR